MRKLLVALMIVAFAATAFADVKLSGSYSVTGMFKQNAADMNKDTDEDKEMYYEHDLDVWLKADVSKDTFFKAKLELADEKWGTIEEADVTSNEVGANEGAQGNEIELERAWMGHNFGGVLLEVGIMDGGGWSYVFGNDVSGKFRVKVTADAGPGKVIAFVQKTSEASVGVKYEDADKDDNDVYFVGYKGKIGSIMITPSLSYTSNGSATADGDVDTTKTKFDMGVGGNFGAVGFETEFIYVKTDNEAGDDPADWGLYGNVFTSMGAAKVGFLSAYDEPDEDNGGTGTGALGGDFDDAYIELLGEEEASPFGVNGLWANVLYAEYDVNDKLGLNASFAYLTSNWEDDDTTAMEIDLGASYSITDALSYSVVAAYASVDADGGSDPDPAYMLYHKLKISF